MLLPPWQFREYFVNRVLIVRVVRTWQDTCYATLSRSADTSFKKNKRLYMFALINIKTFNHIFVACRMSRSHLLHREFLSSRRVLPKLFSTEDYCGFPACIAQLCCCLNLQRQANTDMCKTTTLVNPNCPAPGAQCMSSSCWWIFNGLNARIPQFDDHSIVNLSLSLSLPLSPSLSLPLSLSLSARLPPPSPFPPLFS